MAISIHLPEDLEQALRREVGDLDKAAKEALLIDLYRQSKLTQAQLRRALGLSRGQADELLKRHEVYLDLTADDVASESAGLRACLESPYPNEPRP